MATGTIQATKLLIGMGIIGGLLARGEQPVTKLRQTLVRKGMNDTEIAAIFDALRNGRLRGVTVSVVRKTDGPYWSLNSRVMLV